MARPPKYSPERAELIFRAIRQGNTLTNAAKIGDIAYETLKDWRGRYHEFSSGVEKAEAEAESLHVNAIVSAGVNGNWQASAWWLERRRTGDWRKPIERISIEEGAIEAAADRLASKTGRDRALVLADLKERTAAIERERKAG